MASVGRIPKVMEQAGIGMLPPEAGFPSSVASSTRAAASGGVVIALGLGVLLHEADPEGGLDRQKVIAAQASRPGPMIGAGHKHDPALTVETTLDPAQQPFLYDHRSRAPPCSPVSVHRGLREVASLAVPGGSSRPVEDITFASPFKFYRSQPRTLKVDARFRADDDPRGLPPDRNTGISGQPAPQETVHFTGRVRLVRAPIDLRVADVPAETWRPSG